MHIVYEITSEELLIARIEFTRPGLGFHQSKLLHQLIRNMYLYSQNIDNQKGLSGVVDGLGKVDLTDFFVRWELNTWLMAIMAVTALMLIPNRQKRWLMVGGLSAVYMIGTLAMLQISLPTMALFTTTVAALLAGCMWLDFRKSKAPEL